MENIYELKQKHNRIYILPDGTDMSLNCSVAIVIFLYYKESLEFYYQYIDRIPVDIDLYIVSSRQEVLDKVASKIHFVEHISFVKKPNTGRDISSLLVTMAGTIDKYEYVCFLHDKKEHRQEEKADTDLWIENIWGNLCGSSSQINQILGLFEDDERLGVLAPPDPIGDHFCTWYGYGWHGSFNATKTLAVKLGISVPIEERFPPITIGTALWFRTDALKKLFDFGWKYEDFDDSKLADPNYFCYGVERIFAYVAQDAGYETGEVMSLEYARKQTNIVKQNTREIFRTMQEYFPFPCVYQTRLLDEKLKRLMQYVLGKEKVYLYGCGDWGRFLAGYLRRMGIEPDSFIVSDLSANKTVDNIEVRCVDELRVDKNAGVIITVFQNSIQKEIKDILKANDCLDYYIFWEER